jgi:serine/threonine protein kinase
MVMERSQPDEPAVGSTVPRMADADAEDDDDVAPRQRSTGEPLPEHERAFGRYTLLRRLAFGGMGEVLLARDGDQSLLSDQARLVVIKRTLAHLRRDERNRRNFADETSLQTMLHHPNIVGVLDSGERDHQLYFAMEHVPGPNWRAILERSRQLHEHIPVAHICDMVAQVARGLGYAHRLLDDNGQPLNIVHRDVNPTNVLVSYDAHAKLIDFGIAQSALARERSEPGTIKGKFQYMSPEQSLALALDHRSDLFSLGICLYELLTLEHPFRRDNLVASLNAIQHEHPLPVSTRRPDARPLDRVVKRCLEKAADDRYADVIELADELEALRDSGTLPTPTAPLAVWLRERFSSEIAPHLSSLDGTGSAQTADPRASGTVEQPAAAPPTPLVDVTPPPQTSGVPWMRVALGLAALLVVIAVVIGVVIAVLTARR